MTAATTTVESHAVARPFLKWVGGKTQLLPELSRHVPASFGRYFEPFLGGGALFFYLQGLNRVEAVTLSDTNDLLIKAYQAVRDERADLISHLRRHTELYLRDPERYFYQVRAALGTGQGPLVQVASKIVFLNKTCFNGLFRVNSKGLFNAPWGKYKNPPILDTLNVTACSRALQGANLLREDFETVAATAVAGDFIYFDPPYIPVSETASFTAYTKSGFGPSEQERLMRVARTLKKRGVTVLLSNADVPEVRKIYRGFSTREVSARRNVNSRGDKRGAVGELLIW